MIFVSRPRTARPRPITPSWRGSVIFGWAVPSRLAYEGDHSAPVTCQRSFQPGTVSSAVLPSPRAAEEPQTIWITLPAAAFTSATDDAFSAERLVASACCVSCCISPSSLRASERSRFAPKVDFSLNAGSFAESAAGLDAPAPVAACDSAVDVCAAAARPATDVARPTSAIGRSRALDLSFTVFGGSGREPGGPSRYRWYRRRATPPSAPSAPSTTPKLVVAEGADRLPGHALVSELAPLGARRCRHCESLGSVRRSEM